MNNTNEELLTALFLEMINFDKGDPKRIQHFTKVHSYARLIGISEKLSEDDLLILEAAAYVHDIGIHIAEEKYGYQNGKLQESEGAPAAKEMLLRVGFSEYVSEQVSWLVGHHHTYKNIDSAVYQILVEADFLVNIFEDGDVNSNKATASMKEAAANVLDRIFKTETGIRILIEMFGLYQG